jgi:nanoRNase/pAp phosphatase (c-di-AMP/oligoRNAs hydrolase)
MDWPLNADEATYLLAGLIYETQNFTNTKATPQVLVAAANLIKEGARREDIVNGWYASVELSTLHLWGKILLNLEQTENGLIWSKLDSDEVVPSVSLIRQAIERLLIGLQDAKVIAVFYNLASAQPTVSLSLLKNQGSLKEVNKSLERASSETGTGVVVYAAGAIDLQSWLQDFSPVGSEHFVTFTSNLPLSSTMELILPILSQRLAEIK